MIQELNNISGRLIAIASTLPSTPKMPDDTVNANTDAKFREKCLRIVKKELPGIEKFLNKQNMDAAK